MREDYGGKDDNSGRDSNRYMKVFLTLIWMVGVWAVKALNRIPPASAYKAFLILISWWMHSYGSSYGL